ncbi:hypothetical protein [Nocardia sp. CDC160]|uniref:hypothetical protein n=1 Tax=Nocardia sp. CDC160 TaxID=3112166 RepID=UPI002DBE853B|nr:hypothetical protein [Nocardia sp. CDC160]MEC3915971.1 hypothetical protein [Nocardia sp. CDC160]
MDSRRQLAPNGQRRIARSGEDLNMSAATSGFWPWALRRIARSGENLNTVMTALPEMVRMQRRFGGSGENLNEEQAPGSLGQRPGRRRIARSGENLNSGGVSMRM